MYHSIGKTIATLRKEKGWTQIELAEKLCVSDKAVSKWESESGLPEITQFPAMAKLFDVSIDYIMTGKKVEPEIIAMSKAELCAKNDDCEMVKLKLDKTISKGEPVIQVTTHDGILNIDELLEIKNFKTIKTILDKYPIHQFEFLYRLFTENKIRELFKIAVDNKDNVLANLIVKNQKDDILKHLITYWKGDCINKKHLYYTENGRRIELFSQTYGVYNRNAISIDTALEKLNLCRQRIINEIALKFDKEKTIGDLTKEYFEKELAKGNFDMVIIKLSVRLEAILRSDYHYEGDFSEMLNEYCSEYGLVDDGWGYNVDAEFVKYLHKLRKCRNNIVHSENGGEVMTVNEIKYCIDYICKMG